jgi:hypothetical protein
MDTGKQLVVITENTLAVNGDLCPYQVVELRELSGIVTARYSRYLNAEGTAWVRHGVWQSFSPAGQVTSQGSYAHGLENGLWEDYFENGQVAARGAYDNGRELPGWNFWYEDGTPQPQSAG